MVLKACRNHIHPNVSVCKTSNPSYSVQPWNKEGLEAHSEQWHANEHPKLSTLTPQITICIVYLKWSGICLYKHWTRVTWLRTLRMTILVLLVWTERQEPCKLSSCFSILLPFCRRNTTSLLFSHLSLKNEVYPSQSSLGPQIPQRLCWVATWCDLFTFPSLTPMQSHVGIWFIVLLHH